jgi:photosystem II stability/assembly factor-like uncharacterized protein
MRPVLALLSASLALAQSWTPQNSGTTASLRGVSAVNTQVVWASGTGGTYLVTTNGGATWRAGKVPGAETLDFRAIRAFDARTALVLSIGEGAQSRVYKTTDGGATWKLLLTNSDARGFFDGLAFWDARRGILAGDPVDGHIVVYTTADAGEHWQRRPMPPAIGNEGAFAASNTSLAVRGKSEVWLGTSGAARVFHSADGGRTWTVAATPIRHDGPAAGIFSVAFSDAKHGVAVGGDYSKDRETAGNVAVTSDGGRTWTAPAGHPAGFRSAVAWVPGRKLWVATGTSGSDISFDGGATWQSFDSTSYNALAFVASQAGWAVGARGRVAEFKLQ